MRSGKVYDLVVVGGGIIGLAVARDVARRGLRVVVLDRGRPGAGASEAAAGMLSPLAESSETGPFLEAGLASLALFPDWVAELESETGVSTWFRTDGKLRVAHTPAGAEALEALAERSKEFARGVAIDPGGVDAHLGVACAPALAALHLELDYQVDPRRLHAALLAHVRKLGVEVHGQTEVTGLVESADRVEGVVTAAGGSGAGSRRPGSRSELRAGAVLLAAGAWSGTLAMAGAPPVRPVRGQMLALAAGPHLPSRVVESESVYLVPRQDGRLLVGATVEEVGFLSGCTAEAREQLLAAAVRLIPGLGHAPVLDQWAGLRPGTPDGNPILGRIPGREGLLVATGHYRNGILLAPWTAQALSRLVEGRDGKRRDDGPEGPRIPSAFRPDRFAGPRTGGRIPALPHALPDPVAPAEGSG